MSLCILLCVMYCIFYVIWIHSVLWMFSFVGNSWSEACFHLRPLPHFSPHSPSNINNITQIYFALLLFLFCVTLFCNAMIPCYNDSMLKGDLHFYSPKIRWLSADDKHCWADALVVNNEFVECSLVPRLLCCTIHRIRTVWQWLV